MDKEMENMDVWKEKVQQDIADIKNGQTVLKSEQDRMKQDIHKLELSDQLQNQEINTLKTTLNEIKEDTNWIRRKITGALITAIITALVGGIVGIAIANIF
ncbi:hemolysin XhlA family protein [Psychrobacillus sp. Sa2BUA9]|uniref:Hemolysin XhlA family protein n=1 Tax=Psychrobacillus faecigallinarum TaxID=2762235 RepID=A0ABR8REX3_9BACI|nr:hemolysin XhlA family protein [Psychrobacillus faecigallinarum]MBD7946359.1 hemolysin XhlA family protein [Psychrobacillus faecigallinarum]